MGFSLWFLYAMLMGNAAGAEQPTRTPADLAREIAWARATWPEDFKGLHFHSPLATLLTWAPREGSVPAYLYTSEHACRRVDLSRDREPDQDEGRPARDQLVARINERSRIEDGHRVRNYDFVELGVVLLRENGTSSTEGIGPDGHWHYEGGGGGWVRPTIFGALTAVDDRVARFDGEPLEVHTYCGGPLEWLACPSGGERPCARCDSTGIVFTEIEGAWGHGFDHGKRAVTCHDRCPNYPENPNMARLNRLEGQVTLWRPRKAALAAIPSLYKSRDDCLREHYHGADGAVGGRG